MQYPIDMIDFIRKFPDEQSCIEFLEELRFWKKISCPFCWYEKVWTHSTPYYHICSSCDKDIRVTAGTVFHGARVGLQTLFLIIWLEVMSKRWMSSEEVSAILPISQPSALVWLRKFRALMAHDNSSLLSWDVEVDEIFVGWSKWWKRWRWAEGKIRIVIAVEINRKTTNKHWDYRWMGRVRMDIVPNT